MTYNFGFDVEEDYFNWLCEGVHIDQVERSYLLLARDLHSTIFYAVVPHDENRALDGMELREDYLGEMNCPDYVDIEGDCSVFEMLIGLAKRIGFETRNPTDLRMKSDRVGFWFWEMIDNLGLMDFDDDSYYELGGADAVDDILERLLNREYQSNGAGGLFPLRRAAEDQRGVEIWYQMSVYLNENGSV